MKKYWDGPWYVFETQTRKPFETFKVDATRGLMLGLSALATTHEWRDKVCHISSFGSKGTLSYDCGEVSCRIQLNLFGSLFQNKIYSDVEATTREVCGDWDHDNQDIFIVHGHGMDSVEELKELLGIMNLRPIVLHEQDSKGMTIIEKFEYFAPTCAFAFILMTPDDLSHQKHITDAEGKWRARQNVILEMGWFMAKLGRERVVLLYKGEVEIPNDISGIVYISIDDGIYKAQEQIRQRLIGANIVK